MTSKKLKRAALRGQAAMKEQKALGNEKIVSQVYNFTDLKVLSRNRHMREGETLLGLLTMVEDFERFEFVEHLPMRYKRNPKVWKGEYIIVHRDKNGNYPIQFRKMMMWQHLNPVRVANAICMELLTAKRVLGL